MKKILTLIYWLTFLLVSSIAHAAWNDASPADNEYVYKVPGDIRSNLVAIETATDPALCITTSKVCTGTKFTNTQIVALTSANLVDGSALYSLSSTPSGAGALPIVNGGTGQTSRQAAIDSLSALSLTGTSGESLVSNGTDMVIGYPASLTISSQAEGDILYYTGSAWDRLAASTTGRVLTTQNTSGAPIWSSTLNIVSGNVGIGSATPGQTLDIQGTVRTNNFQLTGGAQTSGYILTSQGGVGIGSWQPIAAIPHTLINTWQDSTGAVSNSGTVTHSTTLDSGTDWAGKNILIIANAEIETSASWNTISLSMHSTSATALASMPTSGQFIIISLTLPSNSATTIYTTASDGGSGSSSLLQIGTNSSGNLVMVASATFGIGTDHCYPQLIGSIIRTP